MKKDKRIKIPYAISNLEQFRDENYYFVDKTKYIELLEDYIAPVFLRPRRFGKTLLCSILEYYYSIIKKDKFQYLFEGTYIGKNPTKEKNRYMVMRFNFSKIAIAKTVEGIEKNFTNEVKLEYNFFVAMHKEYFKDFTIRDDNAAEMLSQILYYVRENNLPKVFIIIDEYDNFTNQLIQSHNDVLYKAITSPDSDSFLKSFFKVIKDGTEKDLSIKRTFITGVLPITIDDLTSGFNIAKIITLKESFHSMLGFTQNEIDKYLEAIFTSYNFDRNNFEVVKLILKKYYNGYRFSPNNETLYNSTISTFFFDEFVENGGNIPEDFIDDNIRTDVNWIKRLAGTSEKARTMVEKLIYNRELNYDYGMVKSKFNMNQFFEEESFPVSLFYLGMLTFQDDYTMTFPNQTLETIFANYYNELEKISVSIGYTDYFRQFMKDLDLEKLFAGYFKRYLEQIPAQACDKVNENFYRTTFYELCTRYLFRNFVLNIESNYPSGRSDLEFLGKYHTEYKNLKWVIEFKHFSKEKAKKEGIYNLKQARTIEIKQLSGYANDILKQFPDYNITKYVIYTISCETFMFFKLDE